MNQINIQYHKTSIAEFIIGSYDNKLCLLDFRYRSKRDMVDNRLKKCLNAVFVEQDDDILEQTRIQLNEYILNTRESFDIPLLLAGTDFQKSVWNGLMAVPYGTTSSYLELSRSIGNEKAVRAVANANGANAIAIIIPCHRIIGNNGKLVGYGGGLEAKIILLNIEKNRS
jgi:methylated-DNA-[protein]-cysteine S-methyltransferase